MQIRMEEVCRRGVERIPEGAMTEPDIFLFEDGSYRAHMVLREPWRGEWWTVGNSCEKILLIRKKREVMVTVL